MRDKLKIQIKHISNGAAVVFILGMSAFILAMMSLGNGKLTIGLILFCTFFCAAVTKAGELVLRTCRLIQIKAWLPAAFAVGFATISLPMVALTLILNVSVLAAFWISTLSVLILNYFSSKETTARPTIDWADTAIALALAIAIGFLAKIPASSPTTLQSTGVLTIWSDYFLHGVTIASFGSPFIFGGDMEMAGLSHSFYHYAPFMIPAAFQTVSGMSGVALAASFLLPLGLLIAALGIYTFAVALGGRLSGLLALTAIICLPASSAFIQSGWFDFYRLLFSAPGSGYALGVSAVVCASTLAYLKEKNNSILVFTVLLLFSLVLIRVHLFMLLAPAIFSLILLDRWRAHVRWLLGATIGVLVMALLALHFLSHLHTLWLEYAHPHEYLNIALQWSLIYGQPISFLGYHPILIMCAQLLVVLAAVLGIYFVLYPLMLRASVRRFGFQAKDALPLLLTMSFIALMLFSLSGRNGDFTEFKHRHFLLLYVVIAAYTITYAFALIPNHLSNGNKFRRLVYGLVISIFGATILMNWNSNPGRPNVEAMPWARNFMNHQITPGLLEAAQYIRTNAKKGDVLAMGVSYAATADVSGPIIEIVSLTGIPAFIARSNLKLMASPCTRDIAIERLSLLKEFSSLTSWPDAQKYLQANGIRWFLVTSGENPMWDPGLKFTVFSIKGVSVYDAGQSDIDILKNQQC